MEKTFVQAVAHFSIELRLHPTLTNAGWRWAWSPYGTLPGHSYVGLSVHLTEKPEVHINLIDTRGASQMMVELVQWCWRHAIPVTFDLTVEEKVKRVVTFQGKEAA